MFDGPRIPELAPASAPDWLGSWFANALRKPEPDKFSVDALAAWLATMPRDGKYSWLDCQGECLMGQFYAASGLPWHEGGAARYARDNARADIFIACRQPHTFGAAHARAVRYLAERNTEGGR